MTEKCFVDTNVLVYASVDEDPIRSPAARKLLFSFVAGQAVISTQVLLEFASVANRRFEAKGRVLHHVLELQKLIRIEATTPEDVLHAILLTVKPALAFGTQ